MSERKLKRYRLCVEWDETSRQELHVSASVEPDEYGEWVPADVAEELAEVVLQVVEWDLQWAKELDPNVTRIKETALSALLRAYGEDSQGKHDHLIDAFHRSSREPDTYGEDEK